MEGSDIMTIVFDTNHSYKVEITYEGSYWSDEADGMMHDKDTFKATFNGTELLDYLQHLYVEDDDGYFGTLENLEMKIEEI